MRGPETVEDGGTAAGVEAQIEALTRDYLEAVNSGDGAALATLFAEDGRFMPPHAPAITGRDAIREAIGQFSAMGFRDLAFAPVTLQHSGDLVVDIGTYTVAIEPPDGPIAEDRGKDIRIWRREPGGDWKLIADIWNSDLAPPAG